MDGWIDECTYIVNNHYPKQLTSDWANNQSEILLWVSLCFKKSWGQECIIIQNNTKPS